MSDEHAVSIFAFASFRMFLLAKEFGTTSFTSYNEKLASLFPLNNFLSFKMLAKICCAIFLCSIISGYQAEVSAEDLLSDGHQDGEGELANHIVSKMRYEVRGISPMDAQCRLFASALKQGISSGPQPTGSGPQMTKEELLEVLKVARAKAGKTIASYIDQCVQLLLENHSEAQGTVEFVEKKDSSSDNVPRPSAVDQGNHQPDARDTLIEELKAERERLRADIEDLLAWKTRLSNKLAETQVSLLQEMRYAKEQAHELVNCRVKLEKIYRASSAYSPGGVWLD